jgi:GNAT superfamily N-acetyltransferase
MRTRYTIDSTDQPDEADTRFVREQLDVYNRSMAEHHAYRRLTIFVRDDQGTIVGGLLGLTYWRWLHVEILWISEELRHQGYGQKLLLMAEQEAIARGCFHAHLDTMSFQARPFYEKLGYTVFGVLDDLPPGHTRYFLKKTLKHSDE